MSESRLCQVWVELNKTVELRDWFHLTTAPGSSARGPSLAVTYEKDTEGKISAGINISAGVDVTLRNGQLPRMSLRGSFLSNGDATFTVFSETQWTLFSNKFLGLTVPEFTGTVALAGDDLSLEIVANNTTPQTVLNLIKMHDWRVRGSLEYTAAVGATNTTDAIDSSLGLEVQFGCEAEIFGGMVLEIEGEIEVPASGASSSFAANVTHPGGWSPSWMSELLAERLQTPAFQGSFTMDGEAVTVEMSAQYPVPISLLSDSIVFSHIDNEGNVNKSAGPIASVFVRAGKIFSPPSAPPPLAPSTGAPPSPGYTLLPGHFCAGKLVGGTGNNLWQGGLHSSADCAARCDADDRCAGFQLHKTGTCWLSDTPCEVDDPQNIVEENAPNAGGWGGTCTCPDGAVYQVGDNNDNCASLSCINGVSGTCGSNNPGGGGVRVTCATPLEWDVYVKSAGGPAPPAPGYEWKSGQTCKGRERVATAQSCGKENEIITFVDSMGVSIKRQDPDDCIPFVWESAECVGDYFMHSGNGDGTCACLRQPTDCTQRNNLDRDRSVNVHRLPPRPWEIIAEGHYCAGDEGSGSVGAQSQYAPNPSRHYSTGDHQWLGVTVSDPKSCIPHVRQGWYVEPYYYV